MGNKVNEEALQKALEGLQALSEDVQTDREARELSSKIAQVSRRLRIEKGMGIAPSPLQQAQEIDPEYRVRPHLAYLSSRLVNATRDVERGKNRQIIVSMPPRSGKSTMTSQFFPLWLMRRHPEWEFVMVSYSESLSTGWAKNLRHFIEDKPELGVALRKDAGAQGRWETVEGGSMFATGTGGALTGRGARVLIIDDPIADFTAAHSPRIRDSLWNWWLSVALTRLEAPYLVLVTMCMTGDTPVLRPDGTETPLRDIRPDDEIATFTDEGEITTSVVANWASQGVDDILTLSMASGRKVRANARHPFWVIDEDGSGSWVRLGSLRAGMKVRCLAAPTEESSAPQTDAISPRSARACACPTTPAPGTQQGIGLRPPHMKDDGKFDSRGVTESRPRTTTDSSQSRMSGVPSVEGTSQKLPSLLTGQKSSASTTAMAPESCEACSATTATSSLLAATRPTSFGGPLSTSVVSTDEIVSVDPAGREEVFDIEVVGTHRFIANGLDVSNTRWHEDDFAGRLLSQEYEGDPRDWENIRLPAVAENDDVLKRPVDTPLLSPIIEETTEQASERWERTKVSVGSYTYSSMYQQRPAPQKGAIFDVGWWKYWTRDASKATEDGRVVYLDPAERSNARWIDSWDCAFKGGDSSSSYVVGQRWMRHKANRYLIAQQRGRWSFTDTIKRMKMWSRRDDQFTSPYGEYVNERIIEDKANGPAIIDTLKEEIAGIKAVNPGNSKEARARAITPEIESGNVYLPHPTDAGSEWVTDLLSELRNFPHDMYDDQVDALTQSLTVLRGSGTGSITVPGRSPTRGRLERDITRTGRSALTQRRIPGR